MSSTTFLFGIRKTATFFQDTYDLGICISRKNSLDRLESAINTYEHKLIAALSDDLGKSTFEAYGPNRLG